MRALTGDLSFQLSNSNYCGGQKFPPFKQFNSPLFNKFGKFATSWKTFDSSAHSKRKYMSVHYRNFHAETTEKVIHDS